MKCDAVLFDRDGTLIEDVPYNRGLISQTQLDLVNQQVEVELGQFDTWRICPHGPDDGCSCRKPAPGLVLSAAADLGVSPRCCVVIGDIGSDVDAATAAGSPSILVPTPQTRAEEIARAPVLAPTLAAAVDVVLAGALR